MIPKNARMAISLLVLALVGAAGCQLRTAAMPEPVLAIEASDTPIRVPPPDPAAVWAPEGYYVEVVIQDLTYPTSAAFDNRGNLYVAEAGYSYGDPHAPARVWRFSEDGEMRIIADQLSGPITDLLWHDGRLYVSHRGRISAIDDVGRVIDLVTGLPSFGDHHNNQMTLGPDGMIYFGQGTATNAGVVGVDNFVFQWLSQRPRFHDRPARDVTVTGHTYATVNPFLLAGRGSRRYMLAQTRPLSPFGAGRDAPRQIEGVTKANGAILRMQPDGSDLQVYAWGLRNPYGVMWGPDGRLYASDNGFDERGSRPIANAPDVLWEVRQGAWYGWPDFAGGEPVTDPKFRPADGPPVDFVLTEHPPVEQPLLRFPPHSAMTKISFNPAATAFGEMDDLFLAVWGPMTPLTGHEDPQQQAVSGVYRIDASRERAELFVAEADPYAQAEDATAGLRRPMQATFSPDGQAMYVVDYGLMTALPTPIPQVKPHPGTGVIWRIAPEDGPRPVGPPAGLSVLRGTPAAAGGAD